MFLLRGTYTHFLNTKNIIHDSIFFHVVKENISSKSLLYYYLYNSVSIPKDNNSKKIKKIYIVINFLNY